MRDRRLPEPRAIDPRSGFDIPHRNLRRQYDGQLIDYRRIDKRNPQEFVRAIPEKIALPNPRPEPPEEYIAQTIVWEDGITPMLTESGAPILTEGRIVEL